MNTHLPTVLTLGDASGVFTQLDILLVMFLAFLLSLILGFVYRATHTGVSYSQSYVQTLVIMGTVVALIMLIIGSNIARAFAMVGALSIVRFRNAMKETRDVGFIFMIMAIGMAVGTRFYLLAILATTLLSIFILLMQKTNLFAREMQERILRLRVPLEISSEEHFRAIFEQHLDSWRMISLETVHAGVLQELVYSVVLRSKSEPQQLLEALRQFNGNQKVTLVMGQQEVDL
ncbi:DUF4956 domain-containing protein [bacterium (Candidatus Blackallbacteria) CG17_big_fil_post_rev_8_21_14_2_50_48_46]|uniref:DUF4956 domain-containing protein n=1 Tax=bacterium (Candidatus Blackallbacteria) CG17_big_fil_post_rev_8_21_14_2_50_48_46 TaxID=2014261 RepID=A0A2M7G8R5_9BACT|nr:MAG: DUF4956 domain-containing protein [bacterium (Candidatus Blackallbacteria) CG18_big_fil_WC_8_21_14_2_50_49_26]PIW18502.1 MAG: DUF4956 domain-containing protein [bacterium (Candidatus Blackallbacteria) CG17_big_fil_post_rev_8_21_14_2_50_48_46]PIW46513.1 MAG: DUF4956 domain-containing protein [bacterium (Candidatus Blackallbacteria) CG13_big_fil_rev_8_21_14_2_50_49_14]